MATHTPISYTYTLSPPSSIDQSKVTLNGNTVPPTGTSSFPITPGAATRSVTASYYAAASSSLREAQQSLNETLTPWKEAAGDSEKHKEDTGKAAYGQGKAARMMAANKSAEASDSDEDGVELEEKCEFLQCEGRGC